MEIGLYSIDLANTQFQDFCSIVCASPRIYSDINVLIAQTNTSM